MLFIEQLLAKGASAAAPAENKFLYTWGSNAYGQLGTTVATPLSSWTAVSAGGSHTAAIRSDGYLFTWGYNNGVLGDGTTTNRSSPVQIGSS